MQKVPETMRIYGVVTDSIVDGPGYRTAVFTQGCPHHCPGCHNPESHDPEGGTEWTIDALEAKFTGNPLLEGITLSGGEPFEQPAACAEVARRAHAKGLTVWTFSGYLYEKLLERAQTEPAVGDLLQQTDVLVDGPFRLEERSLELLYKGSRNQRTIDLNQTRAAGEIVLYTQPEW